MLTSRRKSSVIGESKRVDFRVHSTDTYHIDAFRRTSIKDL